MELVRESKDDKKNQQLIMKQQQQFIKDKRMEMGVLCVGF